MTRRSRNERRARRCALAAGACLLLLPLTACHRNRQASPPWSSLHYDATFFHTGDVLFRRGRDVVSDMVLVRDWPGPFSHVGIVFRAGRAVFVIHTLPREGSMDGGARIEPLAGYLAPAAASAAGLYRLRIRGSGIAERAAAVALGYARRRTPFDDSFELAGAGSRLYCTELVWRAFREAGLDLLDGRLDELSSPLTRGPVILPSSLARSPHLQSIAFLAERSNR